MGDKATVKKILSCSLCLKVVTAPKTLSCYHSFCQKCLESLPKKTDDEGISGFSCSVCRLFTKDAKIQSNLLMTELLELYQVTEKGESGVCQQCIKKKSNWKCTDCKMNLCDECHELHARVPLLKNHRVLPLKSHKNNMLVDRVVFCHIHDDEPVKLNCIDCILPLCIKCKVTEHENHKTETVEKAVDRLIPIMQKDYNQAKEKIKELNQIHTDLLQKVAETKQIYCHCRLEADENLKQLCSNAKSQHKELSENLLLKEEEEIVKLEIAKEKVEFKLKEYNNICQWVDISMGVAKGTSLLSEVETGLFSTVHNLACSKYKLSAIVDHPKLETNTVQEEMKDMVGKVKYEKVVAVSSNVCNNGKHSKIPLTEVFGKDLTKKYDIAIPQACYRLACINGDIWVPIPGQNIIQVYGTDGQLQRSIQVAKQPRSVAQLSSGEIVVAGLSGLIILDNDDKISKEMSAQSFCDIDIIEDVITALNYTTACCEEYRKVGTDWQKSQSIPFNKGFGNAGTIINTKNMYCVTNPSLHTLQKYNMKGQFIAEMGMNGNNANTTNNPGQLSTPYVCAVDDSGNILLADYSNTRIQIASEYEWNVVCCGEFMASRNPYDCKIDDESNIWIITAQNRLMCFE